MGKEKVMPSCLVLQITSGFACVSVKSVFMDKENFVLNDGRSRITLSDEGRSDTSLYLCILYDKPTTNLVEP